MKTVFTWPLWALLLFSTSTTGFAWQNDQVLKKLDQQSFAAMTKKQGAHLDVRVKSADELIPALKIYTGRFTDPEFNLKKYEITRINTKRALIPYFQLSPMFRKSYLEKIFPDHRIKGKYLYHRVAYPRLETLWGISQWYTGTGTHWKAIKKASNLRSEHISKGMLIKIPVRHLFPNLRGDGELDMARPEAPAPRPTPPKNDDGAEREPPTPEPTPSDQPDQTPTPAASEAFVPLAPRESEPQPELVTEQADAASQVSVSPPLGESQGKGEMALVDPAELEEETEADKAEKANEDDSGETNGLDAPQPSDDPAQIRKRAEILKQLAAIDANRKDLRWGQDRRGQYAEYKLRRGEAIYSSVVVRFCGLTRAADVNHVAAIIIQRNGIRDETDLAIGTPIRIPYEHLTPEYKKTDDPDYVAFLDNLTEVAKLSTTMVSRNLEGVHIILDAGHGGRDRGAVVGKVWEDDFVYDIVCRIKKKLEAESGAQVITTVLDPTVEDLVQDVSRFRKDHDEVLQTKPPYSLNNKRVTIDGVHLRWVLANNRYQQLVDQGVEPTNIMFASIHAESLHRSISGCMVYTPDARIYATRPPAANYKGFAEYKGNQFKFTKKSVRKDQARSTNFAINLLDACRESDIRVYEQKPIRSAIYRNPRKPFVPAVIKYNRVPTRCLVEVCNLNNTQDRKRMMDPAFRQRFAEAFVKAVYKTYSTSETGGSAGASTASR